MDCSQSSPLFQVYLGFIVQLYKNLAFHQPKNKLLKHYKVLQMVVSCGENFNKNVNLIHHVKNTLLGCTL